MKTLTHKVSLIRKYSFQEVGQSLGKLIPGRNLNYGNHPETHRAGAFDQQGILLQDMNFLDLPAKSS